MNKKEKVMIFIEWFYPAYQAGGPIKSVFNIIENCKNTFDFLIVSSGFEVDESSIDVENEVLIEKEGFNLSLIHI